MNVPFYLSLFSHHANAHASENIHMPVFCFQDALPVQPTKLLFSFLLCQSKGILLDSGNPDCQTLFKNESRKGWLEAVVLAEGTGGTDSLPSDAPSRQLRRESSDARSLSLSSWLFRCREDSEPPAFSLGEQAGCRGKSILGNLADPFASLNSIPKPPPLVVLKPVNPCFTPLSRIPALAEVANEWFESDEGSGAGSASETDLRIHLFLRLPSQLPELFGATNSWALGEFCRCRKA